jgi:hypothetical protein
MHWGCCLGFLLHRGQFFRVEEECFPCIEQFHRFGENIAFGKNFMEPLFTPCVTADYGK